MDDVKEWEMKNGRIPDGAIMLLNTGWSDRYPNKSLIFNSQQYDDPSTYIFPGWHEDTAQWLLDARKIKALGGDTPSFDYGMSTTFPVHRLILGKGIVGLENVANLDEVPESGSMVFLAVFKLFDGSGGPTRVFATVSTGDAAFNLANKFLVVLTIFVHRFVM